MSTKEKRRRQLQSARSVAERYGVSVRTIDRWLEDLELGFPKPLVINRRRFFYDDQIEAFERRHVSA
jgi:predicted DNA-binding transcriptional regulator AlpA